MLGKNVEQEYAFKCFHVFMFSCVSIALNSVVIASDLDQELSNLNVQNHLSLDFNAEGSRSHLNRSSDSTGSMQRLALERNLSGRESTVSKGSLKSEGSQNCLKSSCNKDERFVFTAPLFEKKEDRESQSSGAASLPGFYITAQVQKSSVVCQPQPEVILEESLREEEARKLSASNVAPSAISLPEHSGRMNSPVQNIKKQQPFYCCCHCADDVEEKK